MRIYTLLTGGFAGEYKIYESEKECLEDNPQAIIHIWGKGQPQNFQVGHYVRALDGYVCQVLKSKKFVNKQGHITYFIRFPMNTIAVYLRINGIWKWYGFHAQYTYSSKSSVSNRNTAFSGKRGEEQKKRFAHYLVTGINPLKAYKLAFDYFIPLTIFQLHHKVTRMIQDPIVKAELISQLTPFVDKLKKRIGGEERLIDELDNLLNDSPTGTKDHRENIKFIMELIGLLQRPITKGTQTKEIEDAEYEVQKPPQLTSS